MNPLVVVSVKQTSQLLKSLKKLDEFNTEDSKEIGTVDNVDSGVKEIKRSDLEFSPNSSSFVWKNCSNDSIILEVPSSEAAGKPLLEVENLQKWIQASPRLTPKLSKSFFSDDARSPVNSDDIIENKSTYLAYKGVSFGQSNLVTNVVSAALPCSKMNTWFLSDGIPNFSKRSFSQSSTIDIKHDSVKSDQHSTNSPNFRVSNEANEPLAKRQKAGDDSILVEDEAPTAAEAGRSSHSRLAKEVRDLISQERAGLTDLQSRILHAIVGKPS